MKKTLCVLVTAILLVGLLPIAFAETPGAGTGVGIIVDPVDFIPLIWMDPDSRIFLRNAADGGGEAVERVNNYAFEGEQIIWDVLVMDKNGVEKISDVYVTIGSTQGTGNDIETNCDLSSLDLTDVNPENGIPDQLERFNPRIGEEVIDEFDPDTMQVYTCTLTVETPNSMYGEYWVVAEVEDLDGNQNTFDENEFWFLNPVIELEVDGEIDFGEVLPGSMAYSDTLTVTNDADEGSGVLLDMQISGTDFYDPASSGAMCPTTNRLKLNNGGVPGFYNNEGPVNAYIRGHQSECDSDLLGDLAIGQDTNDDLSVEGSNGLDSVDFLCYYATNGAYQTANDAIRRDNEGYVGITYATSDDDERDPIISSSVATDLIWLGTKQYYAGNVLTPGADLSITFRLFLPEPCNGAFSDGQIFFWGEAI